MMFVLKNPTVPGHCQGQTLGAPAAHLNIGQRSKCLTLKVAHDTDLEKLGPPADLRKQGHGPCDHRLLSITLK